MAEHGSVTLIPAERYRSADFARLERDRLWPRVWQLACSVDHVASAGDYFEYRCGELSVLIVRGDDGELRAFQNVCRHRGNALCTGAGTGLKEIRCGFHRWAWDLRGELSEVPSRRDFGAMRNADFPLFDVRVGVWGRLVFVNLDRDATPLQEWLEGVPDDIAWIDVNAYRCTAMITTVVPCNWKVVADGFSETYHIQGLHAEMLASIDDIDSPQHLWNRHGKSSQPYGIASPRVGRDVADQDVWDSFIVTQGARMGVTEPCPVPEVPPGRRVQDVIAERIRDAVRERGVDLSGFDTDQMTRLHQYNLFPNATVLFNADMLNVICARPVAAVDAVDTAEMVMFNFERVASAAEPPRRPFDLEVDNSEVDFGLVINQDVALLRNAQRGLRQPALTHLVLSAEECRIANMHRNLEAFLGLTS